MMKASAGWTISMVVLGIVASVLVARSQSERSAENLRSDITPLNMKSGLWQTTMTGQYSGLPAQYAQAMNRNTSYKNCVKPEDLIRNEWARGLAGLKCSTLTVLKSTGTDMEVEAKGCDAGRGMLAEGQGKFHLANSGSLTGTMDVTFSGSTPFGGNSPVQMHAVYTSNWVGPSCP